MSINNINSYKKAKVHTKAIAQIMADLNQAIALLQKHKRYVIVQELLSVMAEKKIMLDAHYMKQKKIVETKGLE